MEQEEKISAASEENIEPAATETKETVNQDVTDGSEMDVNQKTEHDASEEVSENTSHEQNESQQSEDSQSVESDEDLFVEKPTKKHLVLSVLFICFMMALIGMGVRWHETHSCILSFDTTEPKFEGDVLTLEVNGKACAFSPITMSTLKGLNHKIVRDMSLVLGSEIREEYVVDEKHLSTAFPIKFKWGGYEWEMPYCPDAASARVLYSETNGVKPLIVRLQWQDLDKPVAYLPAGFKSVIVNKGQDVLSSDGIYKLPNSDAVIEIKGNTLTFSYRTSDDRQVRKYLDDLNNSIFAMCCKPKKTGELIWRKPSSMSRYRIAGVENRLEMEIIWLNDTEYEGKPILASCVDAWRGIPIAYSCVMTKENWENIRSKTEAKIHSPFKLKVENLGADNVKISIVDSEMDDHLHNLYKRNAAVQVDKMRKFK